MKRGVGVLVLALFMASVVLINPKMAAAYNYGDHRSETLATKAWGSFSKGDLEGVLAYTNKCIELYAAQAQKMQKSLNAYPEGPKDQVFAYWALNDVATSYFIQGEAYRKAGKKEEAILAYKKIVEEYTYGQAWDSKGWFWKPAEAAKEKIAMLESGSSLDFGDYTSSFLVGQAWKALGAENEKVVDLYVEKVMELYAGKAAEMQSGMTEYAWQSDDEIHSKWALNDVGTALFIKGEVLKKKGEYKKAKKAYKKLVDDYFYAQCWDTNGWFWKPAEAAQQALDELGEI